MDHDLWDPVAYPMTPSDDSGWSDAPSSDPRLTNACTTSEGWRFGIYVAAGSDPIPIVTAMADNREAAAARVLTRLGSSAYIAASSTSADLPGLWSVTAIDTSTSLTHQIFPAPTGGPAGTTEPIDGAVPTGLASWTIGR